MADEILTGTVLKHVALCQGPDSLSRLPIFGRSGHRGGAVMHAVWDMHTEEKAKQRGQKLAANAHNRDLALAREIAKELGRGARFVNADMVREAMLKLFPDQTFGNWMGSCFPKADWIWTGGFIKSKTRGSHSNLLRTWRLRPLPSQSSDTGRP